MPCAIENEIRMPCPFAVPEGQLVAAHNGKWCLFHLPEGVKQDWKLDSDDTVAFDHALRAWLVERTEPGLSVPLAGVVFPIEFSFADMILREADFRRCSFLRDVDFSRCTFTDSMNFEGTVFRAASNFAEVKFEKSVDFQRTGFSGPADFELCEFGDRAEFQCNFSAGASFTRASFNDRVSFQGGVYVYARYNECRFQNVANFRGYSFEAMADFDGARFDGIAYFMNANFSQGASFNNGRFATETSFVCSAFGGPISFVKAEFQGNADFTGGKVHKSSDAFAVADFSNTLFARDARFSNRTFADRTNFRGAVFKKAPKFHNSQLHQDTVFRSARFLDLSSEAEQAYRTLKLAMEADRARFEQSEFFALEQTCRRKRLWEDRRWAEWVTSGAYALSARYGQSFLRPIACIFVFLFLFALIYLLIAQTTISDENPMSVNDAVAFAFEQVFRPFHIWASGPRVSHEEWVVAVLSSSPLLLRLTATIHSLVTLGLFAISLVALRRRFHMA